ncbi:MAG TPA: CdaR family protein [Candidatus Binatia bacterium]|nr:CdaR family protein [Candidatus Binatia bacterium]
MLGFVTRNWRLKLLALALAMVAWVGVVYAANPPGVKTVLKQVPQPPSISLPAGYTLLQAIPDLTVNVAGTSDHLSAFSPNFLQVSVDYSSITAIGAHVPATVNLPVKITNTDVNVVLDNPPTSVPAVVDKTGTATAIATVLVGTPPPPGYQISSTLASPGMVTLTGPEHDLAGAQVKTLPIDLGNQRGDFNETLNVYAYDAQSQRLSDVNVSPPSVSVQITVAAVTTSRTSAVVLGPIRGLPSGFAVTSVTYTPMTVTLTGSQDLINDPALASLTTTPIFLNGLIGSSTYSVGVPSPAAGITVSPSSVTVTVTLDVIPTPTPPPTPSPTPTPNPTPSGG